MMVARANVLVGTLGPMVKDTGRRCVGAGPPGLLQPAREVGFFEVEEECWIKAPDGDECSYPDKQACAGDPIDCPWNVGDVGALVPANDLSDDGPSG